MPSKSKAKGNSWELDVAKFLTETYNETFLRVQSSGAFVGGKNAYRKSSLDQGQLQSKKGDIHPPTTWTHLNIECKSYADFPFHQLWYTDVKILDSWIVQQKEVEDEGDLNLILIKISRKDKWVVYPDNLDFITERSLSYKGWKFVHWDQFWTIPQNQQLVKTLSQMSTSPVIQQNFSELVLPVELSSGL